MNITEDLNKIETSATRDTCKIITESLQTCGDKEGMGKLFTTIISNNQITAVYHHGSMRFTIDGVPVEVRKFN